MSVVNITSEIKDAISCLETVVEELESQVRVDIWVDPNKIARVQLQLLGLHSLLDI